MSGSMNHINIRKLTPGDVERLQAIGKQTFLETFSAANSEANMAKYLEEGFSLDSLTQELNDLDTEFYFATLDEEIIGYLKLNFGEAQTELRDNRGLEIHRIYVLREFHGKKIGQILYDKALEVAKANKLDYVWLGVWENNTRAISFYKKNGFVEFDKHLFTLGDDVQTDLMMKLSLTHDSN